MRRIRFSVMSSRRFRSSYALAIALVLGACSPPSPSSSLSEADGGPGEGSGDSVDARHRPPRDAGTTADAAGDAATSPSDAAPADGGSSGSDTGGGTTSGAGIIGCYSSGAPSATCTLPVHCCFTNYSAQHDGSCTMDACAYGTISCDGPEDCPSGQRCCAHAIEDPYYGTLGYTLACQSSACGSAPLNQEMCHPTATSALGTCSTGTQCVTAYGNDNDLPRELYICK